MVVALSHALVPVQPDPVGQAVVVGGDEATLAGRHVLGAVQAERTVPEAADLATAEFRPVRLAGVLDDGDAVPIGDRPDHVHVGGQAEEVDGADGPGPRRDGGLDARGVDDVRVRLDVDEDRRGAGVQDPADRRVERMPDRDDLIARPEAEALEDAHERDRAVAHGDGVLRAAEGGPALLEFGGPPAPGEHAALEDGGDGGDLFRADIRACDGDHALAPCGMDGSGRSSSASPSMA